MSRRPLSIVILQTGETLAPLKERRGGFLEMFRVELQRGSTTGPLDVRGVDVTEKREHDALLDLTSVDGVLMTGSPAMVAEDATWMRWGQRAIHQAIAAEVPFLGVCFGHQLLGVALGADVGPNAHGREIGSVDVDTFGTDGDPLLDGMPGNFRAQVSHVDVIRDPGPKLEVLGRAPHDGCHIVRAGPWAWGVQFHPEFDEEIVLAYIDARQHLIDIDHGPGAATVRLEKVGPSLEAVTVLQRFTRACERRRAELSDSLVLEDERHAG